MTTGCVCLALVFCHLQVSTAYGPFWGWMEGYSSWVSGVADNSLCELFQGKYSSNSPVLYHTVGSTANGLNSWLLLESIPVDSKRAYKFVYSAHSHI